MTRMVEAIRNYKDRVDLPHVAVLLGNVWGGVSASAVPNADLILATSGTNFGFAGPNVIEAFEGLSVPTDSQSAEANLLDRNIDVVLSEVDDVVVVPRAPCSRRRRGRTSTTNSTRETPPLIRNVTASDQRRSFDFGPVGIYGPRFDDMKGAEPVPAAAPRQAHVSTDSDALVEQYQDLMTDANRVDLEFIVRYCFTEATAVYNYVQESEYKRYPAIVGAFAKIGAQPFVIIGTQPSYQRFGDTVIKRPSNPAPEDFAFMERMLEMGERLHLPALFITDTLGAKPTLESERRGLSRAIARSILKGIDYSEPVISLVAGALGSGGGLATTPMADHVMMLEKAMAYVAEPRSAASILYKTPNPTHDEVRDHAGDHALDRQGPTGPRSHRRGDPRGPESLRDGRTAERVDHELLHRIGATLGAQAAEPTPRAHPRLFAPSRSPRTESTHFDESVRCRAVCSKP